MSRPDGAGLTGHMTTTKNNTANRTLNDTTTRPILVLGSTGKTGSRVAAQLRQRGHEVRGASRKGPVTFDWTDENTWEQVLDGAGAAYLVDSQLPDAAESMGSFTRLAVASGVERLVLLSARDWVVAEGEEKLPASARSASPARGGPSSSRPGSSRTSTRTRSSGRRSRAARS